MSFPLDYDFTVRRQPDITFKTWDPSFKNACGKTVEVNGQPCYVMKVMMHRDTPNTFIENENAWQIGRPWYEVTVSPTGPPVVPGSITINNKFYVAAPSVTSHGEQDQANTPDKVRLARTSQEPSCKWTRHTLKDAIAHAEQMLEDNPKMEHVAVVQIVCMVRRKKMPVVVETVR